MISISNIKHTLSSLYHINSRPYSFSSSINPHSQFSDFFIARLDLSSSTFIADNPWAILLGQRLNSIHELHVFDENGHSSGIIRVENSDTHVTINLSSVESPSKLYSFIHKISLPESSRKLFDEFQVNTLSHKSCINNRGYLAYSSNNSTISNFVHGNFGALSLDKNNKVIFSARQRLHVIPYIIPYQFRPTNEYELYFNNPTSKPLYVRLDKINQLQPSINSLCEVFQIPVLGTVCKRLPTGFEGLIRIRSKLPICRPIIMKDRTTSDQNFDAWHG